MATTTKPVADADGPAVPIAEQHPPIPTSKLPGIVRFALLLVLSLSASAGLYSAAAEWMDPNLVAVTSPANQDLKMAVVLGWKCGLLAVGYVGGFDDIDNVALSLLTYAPFYYLLHTFYLINLRTTLLCVLIDTLSIALPTRLLRPRHAVHNPNAPGSAIPNRNIIDDFPTTAINSLLGAAIYAVVLYVSFLTFLPRFLVVHFDNLPSLTYAHTATLPTLITSALALGWSAREFILTPSLAAQTNLGDITAKPFNPETASLWETVKHNVWGYRKQTRVLIARTACLVAMQAVNTFVCGFFVLEGADLEGAVGWTGVWCAASAVVGLAFGVVGDV
ncbi:hypothetical protein K490DRAFT_30891 [Saccharata proteae CBS 121410]|uniref:Uncharacterized protein n=1 Tax=Saccharata proteae CBS 121410 TaxID=1314787 RepID=A0A9P4M0C2_9PEZI|nr:hypothetical protein K490DRAFT_30891 [Saccharata proteae CBS 121410]